MRKPLLKAHLRLASLCLPAVERLLPLKLLLRAATPPRQLRPYKGISVEYIYAYILTITKNPRQMKRRRCLRRGLLLYHFMRLAGLDAKVHISVGPHPEHPGALRAHCWASLEGRCVADGPEADMKPLLSYPPER